MAPEGAFTAGEFNLQDGSVLVHPATTATTEPRPLVLNIDALLIDATSAIDVTGLGYLGGLQGDNASSAGLTLGNVQGASGSGGRGGSYGGLGGGSSSASPGFVYGDFKRPLLLGSGGTARGGNGGGRVQILATSVAVNGAILANGGDLTGFLSGGGSGGSILIETSTLVGSGSIEANGSGVADLTHGGGGGRIALRYDDLSGFTGALSAAGGLGRSGTDGGAGTIFLRHSSQLFGDLLIDNLGRNSAPDLTPLRAVGAGMSTALGANVLGDSMALFPVPDATIGAVGLVGLELNPNTAQGQTFTIVDNTTTQIFTDPADGALTSVALPGDPFIGVYFLDNLDVRGNAHVITSDDISVSGTLTVEPGSTFDAHNLSLP